MIAVALAALAVTLIGVGLERRLGEDAATRLQQRLVTALVFVLGPLVTFPSIATLELDAGVGLGLAFGWVTAALVLGAGWVLARRGLRLDRPAAGSVAIGAAVGNTGYLGIPLCAAVLGTEHLGEAIAWDVVITTPWTITVGFAVGAAAGTRAGEGGRARLRSFLARNPPLFAALAGLLAPDVLVPGWLVDVSEVAAYAMLPAGFLTLGVLLTAERAHAVAGALRGAVALVVVLRLVVAPALFALLVLPVDGVPDAYHLQTVMPCTIMSLVIAHTFGLRERLAALSIAWTTGIVVVAALVGTQVL